MVVVVVWYELACVNCFACMHAHSCTHLSHMVGTRVCHHWLDIMTQHTHSKCTSSRSTPLLLRHLPVAIGHGYSASMHGCNPSWQLKDTPVCTLAFSRSRSYMPSGHGRLCHCRVKAGHSLQAAASCAHAGVNQRS